MAGRTRLLMLPVRMRKFLFHDCRTQHLIKHVIHFLIYPVGLDAGKVYLGGTDRRMTQALADQFDRLAGLQH